MFAQLASVEGGGLGESIALSAGVAKAGGDLVVNAPPYLQIEPDDIIDVVVPRASMPAYLEAVAALATTIGAPADDAGQISAWSQRTGSTVGEPLIGSGESQGVTCVTASEAPSVPAGSFCVWTGTGMRGQTYSVAMSAEDAAALTTELRATTTNTADAAAAAEAGA